MASQAEYERLRAEIRALEGKVRGTRKPSEADIQLLGRKTKEASIMGTALHRHHESRVAIIKGAQG